ncbi:MAG: DUF465 domain-containing protein [Alphaproteobacteria bacterium]|jgi:hypothetical protein|nr:DUF465 domain-containing protein [Alphaproteobacteria bacterium]MBT5389195.1 DUF465 domain-containing protein [Alphaproteobacteria bacterium]MBT5540375.1 DUF465 domain-containing protein [Alphaproteobacteria bacterium]
MDENQELKYRLARLQMKHRDLKIAIEREMVTQLPNQILIQSYKKEKLILKDQISKIENELLPDIIA